jgi:hypothetical protein
MKLLLATVMFLAAGVPVLAQPAFGTRGSAAMTVDTSTIETARELYASARYEEALTLLDDLSAAATTTPATRKIIEQYRSLCLLALGHAEEAEAAIAAVVRADPFYQPSEAEASPRVRETFADVRQRLLPDLASARYAEAKAAYDRKEFESAAAQFEELVRLLDDPQMNGRLPDLRTLASGFAEIAAAAAAPPPPPQQEEPPPAPVEPEPAPPVPLEPKIYTSEEPGIEPPVIVRQEVPAVPAAIAGMTRNAGLLDIVIDEEGRVIQMVLRARIHPVYDAALLKAAKDWKYMPAKLNGTPVRFRKLIQIAVKR